MPAKRHDYNVNLDVEVGRERPQPVPRDDVPFRIAVLGDFGGRGSRGVVDPDLAGRRIVRVDRDNVEDVLAAFKPEVRIPLGGEEGDALVLRFEELEDFHPDQLYQRGGVFRALRETRRQLADPSTFEATARSLREEPEETESPPAALPMPDNVLDMVLESSGKPTPEASARLDEFTSLMRRIVKPHMVPGVDPVQAQMMAEVDDTVAVLMRQVLHDSRFQALEALWRSVYMLTRRVETEALLQIHLIDVSAAELTNDLAPDRDVGDTDLRRLLVDRSVGTPGEVPWALIVGDYTFGADPDDLPVALRAASVAQAAGAPWLSRAAPQLAGCPSFASHPDPRHWDEQPPAPWPALRRQPQARYLGLAAPRFVLRLPYGADGEDCDSFSFEEFPDGPEHEGYLWGNPAFLGALLLAQTFAEQGWSLRPGYHSEVDRLPLHLVRREGEVTATPCAEILLTERAASSLMDRGIMPVHSMKDGDVVRLGRFQSVADPLAALAGRWADAS